MDCISCINSDKDFFKNCNTVEEVLRKYFNIEYDDVISYLSNEYWAIIDFWVDKIYPKMSDDALLDLIEIRLKDKPDYTISCENDVYTCHLVLDDDRRFPVIIDLVL